MSGSGYKKAVETGGRRLPLVRGSFRVDQQATLDASESGVPAMNRDRSFVAPGLVNQAMRLCPSFLSGSLPHPPTPDFISTSEGGAGRS